MQQRHTAHRRPSLLTAAAVSLALLLCLGAGGCSQTADTADQQDTKDIELAMAQRAEMEAGCAAEGYQPGTPEFQSCVGRASIQYTNAGFSGARLLHSGVKHGPAAMETYNAGVGMLRTARKLAVLSDARVKRNLVRIGRLESGLSLYRFTYFGGTRQFVGVLAQDVEEVMPAAVETGADGLLRVDYQQLGFRMMTWEEWVDVGRGVDAVDAASIDGDDSVQPATF
jgi:hypothetical protein